mgnify:CR=1 FL=1
MTDERQTELDYLRAELKTIEASLKELQGQKVDSLINLSGKAMNVVQDYYSDSVSHPKDTLGYRQMLTLSDFRSAYKSMKKWKDNYKDRMADVQLRYQQLDNLEQDLQNGVINDEGYGVGLSSETAAIKTIRQEVESLIEWKEKATSRYHRHRAKVDTILQNIEYKLNSYNS